MKITKYLTFILKGQPYGVPIGAVREINRVTEITPVPQTPAFVAGVINLRGKVIPVVDLRMKLGMPNTQQTKQTCIIVIEGQSEQVGMIVDSVSGVVDLSEDQIEPRPTMGNEDKLNYVLGMGKIDNNVVILIDIVKALNKEELTKIYSTIESSQIAA
ncbi:MAG: chemotaxis protein CheW [Pseudomonadota bacterium]|nr:chemotaxis protein CheW [Pseudomonadota bacterium]